MLLDTKPDECFLNFAQYIDGEIAGLTSKGAKNIQRKFKDCSATISKSEEEFISITIKNYALEHILGYVEDMEDYFNNLLGGNFLKITKIGTGAKLSQTTTRKDISQVAGVRHAIKDINPLDYADKQNIPKLEL